MRVFLSTFLMLLLACAREPAFDPPDIESWSGEPQVATKIRLVRKRALEEPESAAAIGRLGKVFHAHKLHPEAVSCYRRAMELEPGSPGWSYLAALAISKSDLEGSVADFERTVALGPEHAAVHVSFGDVLVRLARFDEAAVHYEKALELTPGSTHALYGLGQLALARGEAERAAEHLEEAARSTPWHGEVHTLLAQVYQRLGRGEAAELELLRAGAYPETTRTPDPILASVEAEAVSAQALTQRGQRLAEDGRFADAEKEFRRVLEIHAATARDHSNLGGALAGQGKLDEAIESYEKSIELAPDDIFALNNLGMALGERGDLEDAAARLAEAIAIDPSSAAALRNLGLVWAKQRRHEEAIAQYRLAIAANPSLAKAHNDLGTALANQGRMDEAMESWRRCLEIDPREISAVYNLSVALVQRGDHGEAIGWLRQGLELAPDSSRLVSLMAWELATAPDPGLRDGAEAERLARRVYTAYPGQPQLGDILAAAVASQGRFDEAVTVAEQALGRAEGAGRRPLAAQIRGRLDLYRRQRAFEQSLLPTHTP